MITVQGCTDAPTQSQTTVTIVTTAVQHCVPSVPCMGVCNCCGVLLAASMHRTAWLATVLSAEVMCGA